MMLSGKRRTSATAVLISAGVFLFFAGRVSAESMKLTCLDESTRAPVAACNIAATVDSTLTYYATDEKGRCEIPLPDGGPRSLVALTFSADKYVPMVVEWRIGSHPVPTEYTALLEPGTAIGGTILSSGGEPVSDASVSVTLPVTERDGRQVLVRDHVVSTDADGKWRCDVVPETLVAVQLQVDVERLSVHQSVQYGKGARPLTPLRDMTDRLVLEERCVVYGGVITPDGKPAGGATVAVWLTEDSWRSARMATTDGWGRFRVTGCMPGKSTFFIRAQGWAPQLQHGEVTRKGPRQMFTLEEGQPLRVRVVDAAGEPLPGSWVTVETWRGLEGILDWQAFADESGEAVWKDAPREGLSLLAETSGAQPSSIKIPRVKDELYMIRIAATTRIRARVVDAADESAIATFEVIPGIRYQQQQTVYWLSSRRFEGTGGAFSFTLPRDEKTADFLKITAPGKAPWVSPEIPSNQDAYEFTARLNEAAPLRGRVSDMSGVPVEGASVFLCSPSEGLYLRDGLLASEFFGPTAKTSPNGTFELSPELPPFLLVVLAESGCALVANDAWAPEMTIEIQPWARLEGNIRYGENVLAERAFRMALAIDTGDVAAPFFEYQGRTDDAGRYRIDQLPSLDCHAVFDFAMPDGSGFQWPTGELTLRAGEPTNADIGGVGQAVNGAVPLPDQTILPGQGMIVCTLRQTARPDSPNGPFFQAWTPVDRDGTFHFAEAPPGTYRASVSVPRVADEYMEDTPVDHFEIDFEVNTRGEGEAPGVIDLGKMTPPERGKLAVGEPVPGFNGQLLDGTPVSLADYAGRYVLIDVWATWCGPCVGEVPYLKAVYEEFAGEPGFAMLSISLDSDKQALLSFLESKEMDWPQVFAGENPGFDISSMWGINGIPAILLVGPDGTLVAQHLRGEAIGVAVRQALRFSEDGKGDTNEQP